MEISKKPNALKENDGSSKNKQMNDSKTAKIDPSVNNKNKKKSKKLDDTEKDSKPKVIRLLGNRSVYHVGIDDFVKVSSLLKQQQNAGNLMTSVDLNRFSDQSILAFVNYIQNKEIKSSLTYYAITELVTLAKTFLMRDLKECLEDSIIEASKNSEADLLQTLIICDVTHISPETERTLQLCAIDSIEKIVTLPDFHRMPFHQLYQILSSCELNVNHEMFVVDVILLWLSDQVQVNAYAPALFSCIRSKFLSPVDKTLIIERINMLNLPDKIVRLARNIMESSNNLRSCMDTNHQKKNYPRCSQCLNISNFGTHSSLPLSRPNFTIKMKKTKEAKTKEKFDPNTNPKVMDLIQKESKQNVKPRRSPPTQSFKKKRRKKNQQIVLKKEKKCACIEFVKKKLCSKKRSRGKKDLNPLKVKPPGSSSSNKGSKRASSRSEMSTKSKSSKKRSGIVTSKYSSSNNSAKSGSISEQKSSMRRAQKREKINSAMESVSKRSNSRKIHSNMSQ